MIIRKTIIKFWQFAIAPQKIDKVKQAAEFHKKCEYFQTDIEYLFSKGIFEDWAGCAEIHRGQEQRIRDAKVFIRRLM